METKSANLEIKLDILTTKLIKDNIVEAVCRDFTYDFQDEYTFIKHSIKEHIPTGYGIGLITGTSGTGKSLLLNDMGYEVNVEWEKDKAICSHFNSYEEATERLMGAGFNSIPSWLVPFSILSTGQKYRVNLARSIQSGSIFDEFTSVIDRGTALGLANSVQKYIREKKFTNIVFASVHKDIIPYLQADWVYNTDDKTLEINSKIWDMSLDTKTEKVEYKHKQPFMKI